MPALAGTTTSHFAMQENSTAAGININGARQGWLLDLGLIEGYRKTRAGYLAVKDKANSTSDCGNSIDEIAHHHQLFSVIVSRV